MRRPGPLLVAAVAALGILLVGVYVALGGGRYDPLAVADPCQPREWRDPEGTQAVAEQIALGEERIMGVMVESHLVEGRQDLSLDKPLTYGQSITDACINWDDSISVMEKLAAAVRARRLAEAAE